jgi:hypothetical protein
VGISKATRTAYIPKQAAAPEVAPIELIKADISLSRTLSQIRTLTRIRLSSWATNYSAVLRINLRWMPGDELTESLSLSTVPEGNSDL